MIHNNLNLQPGGLNNQRLSLNLNNTQKHHTEKEEEEEAMDVPHTSNAQSKLEKRDIVSRFLKHRFCNHKYQTRRNICHHWHTDKIQNSQQNLQ
jgi:hypothetical protein